MSTHQLADLVGLRTYTMLSLKYPCTFEPISECKEYIKDEKRGFASTQTDFERMFIDTDYTPEDLKEDLQAIRNGCKPENDEATLLVNSSCPTLSYQYTPTQLFGFVLVSVIFWFILIKIIIIITTQNGCR